MVSRVVKLVAGGAFLALLLLGTWPQALQLHQLLPAAQLISFRGIVFVIAAVSFTIVLLIGLVSPHASRFTALSLVALLVVVLTNGLVLFMRGTGGTAPERDDEALVGLAWNTLGEVPPVEQVAELAMARRVDVIALPETGAGYAERLAGLLAAEGRSMQVFARDDGGALLNGHTALLVSTRLGQYRLAEQYGDTGVLPSVVAEPVAGAAIEGAPTLVAVHAIPPMPTLMNGWREDLRWLAALCGERPTMLLGDFNATLDHFGGMHNPAVPRSVLGDCRDGAEQQNSAALGTWPSWAPPLLGTPIDHVLATPHWRFTGFEVLTQFDRAGSDHRPVLASLVPAG